MEVAEHLDRANVRAGVVDGAFAAVLDEEFKQLKRLLDGQCPLQKGSDVQIVQAHGGVRVISRMRGVHEERRVEAR